MKRIFCLYVAIVSVAVGAEVAGAATLNGVGGQLLGASGVDVGGTFYDVEFLDGSCIDSYNGCDAVSDFAFQSEAAALLAAQAFLDHVFLDGTDLFDTDPALTLGCTSATECVAVTPFAFLLGGDARVAIGRNRNEEFGDGVSTGSVLLEGSLADIGSLVFAAWTPIPEPGTAPLMGLGLFGLAARRQSLG